MVPLKTLLRRTFPGAAAAFKATRSRLHRLRHGDGDVAVFDRIMAENYWRDAESVSGGGSNLRQTETLRREVPLDGITYTGVDVVAPLIERVQQQFAAPGREFLCRNIVNDPLPRADAI